MRSFPRNAISPEGRDTPGDTLCSCRAIFIEDIAERNPSAVGDLARFFRIVLVTRGREGQAEPPGPLRPPFSGSVHSDRVGALIREKAIEWYASWFIGSAPDIGFRGVLPGASQAELQKSLREIRQAEARSSVVIDYGRLGRIAEALRRRGKKIVFTNGVFDLLHMGHLGLLEQARALGDALIVAINSDDSTRGIKGAGRPVIPQFARARLLASLRQVDVCFIFPEPDPIEALHAVRPDVLAKGSEYDVRRIVGARFVSGYGGKVVRIPMVQGWSTTSTIRSIRTK